MSALNNADIVSHIFSADPVASWKYEQTHVREPGFTSDPGLRRLMMAVLKDGIDCLQVHFFKPSRRNELRFREAEEWITSDDPDYPISFNNVCEGLGIDPGWLRKELFRWKEMQLRQNKAKRPLCKKAPRRNERAKAQAPEV